MRNNSTSIISKLKCKYKERQTYRRLKLMRFCFACRALTGAVSWTTFCISTWRPCCPAQSVDTWAKRTSKHPSTPSETYSKSLRGSWSNVWVSKLIYLRSFRSCAQAAAPERARAKKKAFVWARLPMSPAVRYKIQNVFPLWKPHTNETVGSTC